MFPDGLRISQKQGQLSLLFCLPWPWQDSNLSEGRNCAFSLFESPCWEQSLAHGKGLIHTGRWRAALKWCWTGQPWALGQGLFMGFHQHRALHSALYTVTVQCLAIECGWNISNGQIQLNCFDSTMAFFFDDCGGARSGLARVLCKRFCPTKIYSHLMPSFYPLHRILVWALSSQMKHLRYQLSFPRIKGFCSSRELT